MSTTSGMAGIPQEYLKTQQDKIIEYVTAQNNKIDFNTAKSLADSVVFESINHKIPVNLILGLIKVESGYDQFAFSNAGAMGWMQVMPKVHREKLMTQHDRDIYSPKTNIALGVKILSDCLQQSGNMNKALLCYNGSQSDKTEKYAKLVLEATPRNI